LAVNTLTSLNAGWVVGWDGFVAKTDNWQADVDWADLVVFDDVLGQGTHAHRLRKTGKLVVGGTPYTDRLEDDRAFGQQELKSAGVSIIPQENFTSFDDAIKFVESNPGRYVIKPSGEAQNYKRLLFVGEEEDGHDVLQVLGDYKTAMASRIKPTVSLTKTERRTVTPTLARRSSMVAPAGTWPW